MSNLDTTVFQQTSSGEFFVEYTHTKLEDVTDIFFTTEELMAKHLNGGRTYNQITSIVTCPPMRMIDYHVDGVATICFIKMQQLLSWVQEQFKDPKVKAVPCNIAALEYNYHNFGKVGLHYQTATNQFIRNVPKKVPVTIPASHIQRMKSRLCNGIVFRIGKTYSFNNVTITTNTSNASKNNTVVLAKKLGIKLDKILRGTIRNGVDYPVSIDITLDEGIKLFCKESHLPVAYEKQLLAIIKKWWKDAKQIES